MTSASTEAQNSSKPCGSLPPASRKSKKPSLRAMKPSTLMPTTTDALTPASSARCRSCVLPLVEPAAQPALRDREHHERHRIPARPEPQVPGHDEPHEPEHDPDHPQRHGV